MYIINVYFIYLITAMENHVGKSWFSRILCWDISVSYELRSWEPPLLFGIAGNVIELESWKLPVI